MTVPKYLQALISAGRITQEDWDQIDAQATKTGKEQEVLLVEKKLLSEEDIAKAKSDLFELPYVDLAKRDISTEVVSIIPQAVAENYQIAVFEKEDKMLKIAMVDPSNYRAIEAIDFWAKKEEYQVSFFITTPTGYRNATKNYRIFTKEVGEALGTIEERTAAQKKEQKKEASKPLVEVVKKAPVAQIVTAVIKEAFDAGASDIHIEPFNDQMRIRFRIDGQLRTMLTMPLSVNASIVSRIKILSGLKIDETRVPQDGRLRIDVDGKYLDLRVSTLPLLDNEKVVMRLLPAETHVPTLDQLGFWYGGLRALESIIARPTGVLLISGPTGSGKTTTLHSMLNTLNTEGRNIITLEDPVEYFLAGVNQVQIHHEVGLTFSSGLRAVLRQDPNIVMVGEIRDLETAELAIQAALTGHFMMSTVHSKDVIGIIPRLMDMKVEPFLISASLNAMTAQRLVRKICDDCKEQVPSVTKEITEDILGLLKDFPAPEMLEGLNLTPPFALYRGRGCDKCNGKGYRGRTVVSEVAVMNDVMRGLIKEDISIDALQQEMRAQGMVNLKEDGMVKALRGFTTYEDVLLVTRE